MVEYDKESSKNVLIIILIFIVVFVLKSFDMELENKKSIENNKTEIAYTEEEFQKIRVKMSIRLKNTKNILMQEESITIIRRKRV